MSVCGRCRGRGYVKRIRGIGHDDCPVCKGTGVKPRMNSLGARTVSVPLDGARCIVCNEPAVHHHHVVPQQRLDRYLTPDQARQAKHDRRNVTPLCFACHDRVESGTLDLARHELHPDFPAFVFAYDLEAALPRYMTHGAAVPIVSRSGDGRDFDTRSPREDAA